MSRVKRRTDAVRIVHIVVAVRTGRTQYERIEVIVVITGAEPRPLKRLKTRKLLPVYNIAYFFIILQVIV